MSDPLDQSPLYYRDAGVDIEAAEAALDEIKKLAKSTFTPSVEAELGLFGGLFNLAVAGRPDDLLVASTDGVGTKVKLALEAGRHEGVGEDLVNHCVNDILVQGALPLFFMDYFATGQLDPFVLLGVVKGLAKACREAGCALLGGETAEMPGVYHDEDYDLAGTIVGWVPRNRLLDGSRVRPGDVLLGLASAGLHTNGFSLARKVFFERHNFKLDDFFPELGTTLADSLLTRHVSYLPALKPWLDETGLHAMAHITGGGIPGNLVRVLPKDCTALVTPSVWTVPPIFAAIQRLGNVERAEMYKVFNMGVGMILILDPTVLERVRADLTARGTTCWELGRVIEGKREVLLV